MIRHRSRFLALVIALALIVPGVAAQADTTTRQIAKPIYRGKVRTKLIRRGRNQRFRPQARQQLATELKAMDVNSKDFQKKVSSAPLQVRMEVFSHFAQQASGTAPTTFTRRLRGMLKQHGKTRVSKPSKSFFEVTNSNFDLFKKVMGKNVIWFAVNSSPGHLHTLIHDQNNGGKFHHNVYGEGSGTNDATITNNMTQYALPVVLTDSQMKRFTSYMNAGLKHHRHGDKPDHSVYGFFSRGNKVTKIACTNWVTSASIGELPRWAKTIDKRLVKMAAAGQITVPQAVAKKGLHAALVGAGNADARQQIVTAVLGNTLTKWNKSAVKRMAKQFNKEATAFPNKPTDLLMRDALAKTLGLGRSQDPAKWSYDLLMSKKVPVVAILNGSAKAKSDMTFNMEIMGTIGTNGWVKKTTSGYFGYNAPQNAGALGVIPDGRSTAVRPAATPAQ
jgi:hypothetical protein